MNAIKNLLMKKLFIETKYEGELDLSGESAKELVEKLPKRLVLAASVQYLDQLQQLKTYLEENGKEITLFKSQHGKYPGQSLGCDIHKFQTEQEFDAFLYLGDGMFHPTALAYNNEKPVFIFNPMNPEGMQLKQLEKTHWEKVKKRKNVLLAKLIEAKHVGILVTRKPGQNQSKVAEQVRKKLESKGKKVFVFLADNINTPSLQDFNFVEVWINTACPRMIEDFACLNWMDLREINYF